MKTETLIKTFNAQAQVAGHTIATFGAADMDIEAASAALLRTTTPLPVKL